MTWKGHIDGEGVWVARSGAQNGGLCRYDVIIVVKVLGRFLRVTQDAAGVPCMTRFEALPFPPETVYMRIESMEDSMALSGWRVREKLASGSAS